MLQIVTTGPVGEAVGDRGQQSVRDVSRARDVALVALVGLPHVQQDDGVLPHERLELFDVDRFEPFLAAGRVDDEPFELQQADGTKRPRGVLRLSG